MVFTIRGKDEKVSQYLIKLLGLRSQPFLVGSLAFHPLSWERRLVFNSANENELR